MTCTTVVAEHQLAGAIHIEQTIAYIEIDFPRQLSTSIIIYNPPLTFHASAKHDAIVCHKNLDNSMLRVVAIDM
jgi:hypothetical protein